MAHNSGRKNSANYDNGDRNPPGKLGIWGALVLFHDQAFRVCLYSAERT